jgi:transposase InsO family protein
MTLYPVRSGLHAIGGKRKYVHRRQFRTRAEARIKIATWITDFYNHRRRHSACDGHSPIDYERSTARPLEAQAA